MKLESFTKPVKWYKFWVPQSGAIGGAIFGVILIILIIALLNCLGT